MAIQLGIAVIFGVIIALVARARGRSTLGWFVFGFLFALLALIVLLVLPDLKKEEAYKQRVAHEQKRLTEQVRQERIKGEAFRRYSMQRLDVHDETLGVDTRSSGQLNSDGPMCQLPLDDSQPSNRDRAEDAMRQMGGAPSTPTRGEKQWYYEIEGRPVGPVSKDRLSELLNGGKVNDDSLVWSEGFEEWRRLGDVKVLFTSGTGDMPGGETW